jgi:hypothetical protein
MINGHGVAGVPVPFKGTNTPRQTQLIVDRLRAWNQQNAERQFTIGISFTIRADHTYVSLRQMGEWATRNGVNVLRFNAFAKTGGLPEHEQWVLDRSGITRFYAWVARLHDEMTASGVQISVSEDFGDAGIDQIEHLIPPEYQGQQVGRCRAGRRLFAVIQVDNQLVVTGCVDRPVTVMGKVVRRMDGWDFDWDLEVIARFCEMQVQRRLYGCWGLSGWGREAHAGFNDPEAEKYVLNG